MGAGDGLFDFLICVGPWSQRTPGEGNNTITIERKLCAMKGLAQFSRFDLDDFLADKDLAVTGLGPWKDYNSGTVLGTKVELVITRDETTYKPGKDGAQISNLFEKLTVKVPKDVNIPIGSLVEVINGTATVYGDYRNQLSIKAEDVKAVSQTGGGKNG